MIRDTILLLVLNVLCHYKQTLYLFYYNYLNDHVPFKKKLPEPKLSYYRVILQVTLFSDSVYLYCLFSRIRAVHCLREGLRPAGQRKQSFVIVQNQIPLLRRFVPSRKSWNNNTGD